MQKFIIATTMLERAGNVDIIMQVISMTLFDLKKKGRLRSGTESLSTSLKVY